MSKRVARDLQPGDHIDVPAALTEGTDNQNISLFEYAEVESVNGGWADTAAGPDEVVVYTTNYAVPIIAPADFEFELAPQEEVLE